jgi:hypothetical protein
MREEPQPGLPAVFGFAFFFSLHFSRRSGDRPAEEQVSVGEVAGPGKPFVVEVGRVRGRLSPIASTSSKTLPTRASR